MAEHKFGGSSEEDGSWEKLAEDLLGIDFGKSNSEADVPEIDSLLTPETTLAKDSDAFADDADSPEPASFDPADSESSADPDAAEELKAHEPHGSAEDDPTATPDKEVDTFWDPLNEWDWDTDSTSKTENRTAPKPVSSAKREPVEPKPTASPRYEEPSVLESAADLRDEYNADADFGFGLLDDEEDTAKDEPDSAGEPETMEPAVDESTAAESTSTESTVPDSEQAEVSEPKRRRRRRGRRGRGRQTTEADSAAEKPEEGSSELPDQAVTEPQIEEAPKSDEAVARSDEESAKTDDSSDIPRRGRRQSSRRRRKPSSSSKSDGQETPSATEPAAAESVTADSGDKSNNREEPAEVPAVADDGESSSRKIPTWEEAISYLHLNPTSESRS